MYPSVRSCTVGLAAAGAGILTLGLVSAPPNLGVALAPAQVPAVQLAAVTAADIGTEVVKIPVEFAAEAKAPSLVPAAARSTTTPVIQPAAATQTEANPAAASLSTTTSSASSATTDLNSYAASFIENLKYLVFSATVLVGGAGLAGLAVTLSAAAFAWNGFANLVNPTLDALGQQPLQTIPVCFFGGVNCGGELAAPAQARLAAPAETAAEPAYSPTGPTVAAAVGRSSRAGGAAQHPTRSVGRGDESLIPTAMSVRTFRRTPGPTVSVAASTNEKNNTAATEVGSSNKAAAAARASAVGSSKRDRKTAAHSSAARSVGGSKRKS